MKSRESPVGATWMWALATLVVVDSLLLGPSWIAGGGLGPHVVALESLVVVGLFLALPRRRWSSAAAWIAAALLTVLGVLLLGDATARASLARPLNLYLDLQLLGSVSDLLVGALGPLLGLVVVVAGVAAAVASFVVVALLLSRLRNGGEGPWQLRTGVALALVGAALIPARWLHPRGVVFGLPTVQLVKEQSSQLARMAHERERFEDELRASPSTYADTPGLLERLDERDVVMAFIESYGMTTLEDPRYAPVVRPSLLALKSAAAEAGVHMVTAQMVAPSQGGQSWLGHGSILSGLWLENQLRYDLLLASDRETLVDDFEAAGYRTVAIMPAITMAWPEGERLGYDRVYARADIDYRGPPLNWVTMPDQFTWSFLENRIRGREDTPLFAEIGLISSHAPWTPILPVIESWDSIGDGGIFHRWAGAGEKPEELWRDRDRVREHYAMAIRYALDVLGAYVGRFVDDGVVVIALGDHQPAPLVTGEDAPRTVPVHVFAADSTLLEPFVAWGFAEGPFPAEDRPPRRMDAFRPWFVRSFSGPGEGS